METKSSKRRQMATLLCSLGAIVIGGVAADAWASVEIVEKGNQCYVCFDLDPQLCNYTTAAWKRTCYNACEYARCDYGAGGFTSYCENRASLDPDCLGDPE
jgi:hypothetical protein